MLRIFNIEQGLIREIEASAEKAGELLTTAHWIDAHEPDERERGLLQRLLPTEVPDADDVEEIESSARCFIDRAGIHIHTLFLSQTQGRHKTLSVASILQDKRLITIAKAIWSIFDCYAYAPGADRSMPARRPNCC